MYKNRSWFVRTLLITLGIALLALTGCGPAKRPPAAYIPPRIHAYAASDSQINVGWFKGEECSCPTCICKLMRGKEILVQDARNTYEDIGLRPDTEYQYNLVSEDEVIASVKVRTRPKEVMRKSPYLVFTGNNRTMKIMWHTWRKPRTATIQWAPDYQMKSRGKVNCSNGPMPVGVDSLGLDENLFSFTIKNLRPSSTIFYRVTVDGYAYNGSFRTAPSEASKAVSFYAYGNTHTFPRAHGIVAASIMEDLAKDPSNRHTICLNTGNFVTYGLDESYWDSEFFNMRFLNVQRFLAHVPVVGALGNHETYRYPLLQPPGDGTGGTYFHKYWPYGLYTKRIPKTKDFYYSFDYGPVHFVVLDAYPSRMDENLGYEISWNAWPISEQYKWLEQDLRENQGQWLVVMVNTPIYGPEKNDFNLRKFFEPLFKQFGVNLVLQGKNSYYARVNKGKIPYMTLGGGGARLTNPWPEEEKPPEWYKGKFSPYYHFARFDVDDDVMKVTVIKPDGTAIDNFVLKKEE